MVWEEERAAVWEEVAGPGAAEAGEKGAEAGAAAGGADRSVGKKVEQSKGGNHAKRRRNGTGGNGTDDWTRRRFLRGE